MICELCGMSIKKAERHKLTIHDKEHFLHDKCLRKATKKQLVDKKVIGPEDFRWRL